MAIETIEYSVCEDCLQFIANDVLPEHNTEIEKDIERELNGRDGHFTIGVEETEDDPDGDGYDEFSNHECELCRSGLAGSRHGVTLVLPVPEASTIVRRVMWEIDVEFPADASDRDIAKAVAETYFQSRIAAGEPDTACVFKVVSKVGPDKLKSEVMVDLSK